ncbi:MAG: hypothetical protein IPL97_03125 [Niastella sp.]|nr:hypothetical protein [Niastella sp.]
MKRFFYTILSLFTSLILLCNFQSCKEMGSQPPETVSLTATDDGSKIARLYSVFYVSSYTKRSGSTMRYGSSTYYLEMYDGFTGKRLTENPIKLKSRCQVFKLTDKNIWLRSYNNDTKNNELLIINNLDGTVLFNAKTLAAKNKGLSFEPTYEYYNPGVFKGTLLQADDARLYALDESTGLASVIPDSIHLRMINRPFFEISSTQFGESYINFTGVQRKRLVKKIRNLNSFASQKESSIDFINPFLLGKLNVLGNKEVPVFYKDCFFVFSQTKSGNQFEWQINMLDTVNLQSKWTAIIHKPGLQSSDNKLTNILLHNNQLLTLGKDNIHLLNVETGKPVLEKAFTATETIQ